MSGDIHERPTRVTAGASGFDGGARAGETVGPFELLERIGEGGFGEVWLAERRAPFAQRAAIKLIKQGMDSRSVLARFEQERQALAVMDHPNVAKVLDGGATTQGRPYFVMKYVQGEPITDYCDRARLTTRQRIELMIPVRGGAACGAEPGGGSLTHADVCAQPCAVRATAREAL